MTLMPYVAVWCGLGLIGSMLMLSKAARPEHAIFAVLFSLLHAMVFGPIFLLLMLFTRPQKICPFCQSQIDRAAVACSECTRDIPHVA